ncbi:MAG: hypothetical protein R3F61_10640 [Myxococcota bacterium]
MKPWFSILFAGATWGCTCSGPVERAPSGDELVDPGHFSEWGPLVDAVASGRSEAAHVIARDMTEGSVEGSAEIGSALGFLQLAEGEELADGLAAAAVACGACHRDIGVAPPDSTRAGKRSDPRGPPAWTHPGAARFLADVVVWSAEDGVREKNTDLRRAWDAGADPEAKLAGALKVCQTCHSGAPPVASEVIAKLCDDPCGGDVDLFRPADGPVDRLVQSGDLGRCSHIMMRWATLDGTVEHQASDRPAESVEAAEQFQAAVSAFMGERVRAAVVDCPEIPETPGMR